MNTETRTRVRCTQNTSSCATRTGPDEERLIEVARLLAEGWQRLRLRQMETNKNKALSDVSLDLARAPSMCRVTKTTPKTINECAHDQ
jgi:hypothetical protein